jgi:hypothetical protein
VAALLAGSAPAGAVEYRLQVVSVFQEALTSFLKPGEVRDGASGPGLDQLEAALDQGRVPPGAVLWDRRVLPAHERPAAAWGAVAPKVTLLPAGNGRVWDEVRWEGNPGDQTVWLIAPGGRNTQELYRLALRGTGPMRYYQPYNPAWDVKPQAAPKYPLSFIWFYEERGTIWSRYVSRSLDLGQGIAIVLGTNENDNASFPDSVYILVRHAAQPTTYKTALGWKQRDSDREAPTLKNPMR